MKKMISKLGKTPKIDMLQYAHVVGETCVATPLHDTINVSFLDI
jgi:hypothetical protein